MLFTILVMATAVSLEPFRIGMTVLMLNRPRPLLQLLAFLCGGFAMGTAVGVAVLFVFRRVLLGSTYFTLPRVQILIGTLALLAGIVLAVKVWVDRLRRRDANPVAAGGATTGPGLLVMWTRQLLQGPSLWIAGVAGLGIALPSVDYLAALAVVLASGAAVTTQLGALLMFNVVAFAFVEIPLVASLIAPEATRASMVALQDWIRSRRRAEVATLLAVVGGVLLVVGATAS